MLSAAFVVTAARAADEGALTVHSEPEGAAVYVDGRFVGQTPVTLDAVTAGDHRVVVAKDGYLENRRLVRVARGQIEAVRVRLTARTGQAPPQAGGLRIVVIEGEDAVNIIQQGTAVLPIVEVRDRNDLPVAGATVVFSIGGGGGATFAGGATSLTVTTNAAGRAAVTELNPVTNGSFQINVEASYQGQTASTSISQTNVPTPADAAALGAGGAAQAGAAGGAGAGGGGLSGLAITGIAAGAAAGTLVGLNAAGVIGGDDPCTFTVTPISISASSGAGATTVNVTASPSGCSPDSWNASSVTAFVTVNPTSGAGNGAVTVNVAANTGGQRTGTATIAGQTVTVTQGAACTFTVMPTAATAPGAGGIVTVGVSVGPAGCAPAAWTAASNASFIAVSPASGTGNGSVTLSVSANPGVARTGTATVAGQTVTLTQSEAARPCNAQQVAGGDIPETRTIELGRMSGTFGFAYDTATIEDRLVVRYEGRILFDTGCVGTNGVRTQSITYAGNSSTVTVEVTPNCRVPGSGTAWAFVVSCPQ
jgi:hypothetical protein